MALLREPAAGSPWTSGRVRAAGGPRAALSASAGLFADSAERRAAALLSAWREEGFTACSYADPGYPPRLRQLDDAPPLLFLRGELSATDADGVAVIGSRRPSAAGLRCAAEIATALVRSGQTVISGLAAGVDAAAHSAALAAGGRSVAVLGTGLRHAYPAVNAELQGRLTVLVSQFWPEERPSPTTFPLRNAVMSGISRATVIVEAGARSGARIQARHALAQGRPLFLLAPLLREEWARALDERPGVRVIQTAEQLLGALR